MSLVSYSSKVTKPERVDAGSCALQASESRSTGDNLDLGVASDVGAALQDCAFHLWNLMLFWGDGVTFELSHRTPS